MSRSGILGLEKQHLRDDQVRDAVVNRRAEEDDAVLEQARKDVVRAFPAVGLFDHHRESVASVQKNEPCEMRPPETETTSWCGKLGRCRVYVYPIVARESRKSMARSRRNP